jgi:ribosome-binding ATPase YchF (GTP1/OBG family)
LRSLQLLSVKPVLYIANVAEASAAAGSVESGRVAEYAAARGARSVVISAAIEAELAQLADVDEKREFLAALGLEEPGLARVIRAGYALLHLVTFFTAGPKEAHAWTVEQGTKAPQAAGKIHTDFEKGFIRAETIAYGDFAACGGEQGARDAGRMRLEGADYVVQDGDVMRFRFNL